MSAAQQTEDQAATSKLVVFHRLIPAARLPQRADRSAAGMLPTRAFRYCEPATTASGFGFYVFPAFDYSLRFDGTDVFWTYQGVGEWFPIPRLTGVQFPGFADYFAANAPPGCADFAPPFLVCVQEPGFVQMWTGIIARTAPGWSALVRPPANFPAPSGYQQFEGLIETDHWFGPLITNIKLTRTDRPVDFRQEWPLIQVQPVQRAAYQEAALNNYELVPDIAQMTAQDWADFETTVVRPNTMEHRPRGQYATEVRKRRAADSGGRREKSEE